MSYQPTIKEFFSEDFDITKYILLTNDSLTLIQFMRLLKNALDDSLYLHRNPDTTYLLEDIHIVEKLFNSDLKDKIGFIMKNSKNNELLNNTTDLLRTASNFSDKKVKKSDDGPQDHLTEAESLRLEWSIFDYKPMRIGLYSSLETQLENFSVLDTDDNIRLCNTLILIHNIIVVGKSLTKEMQFNIQEGFPHLSKCFDDITKAIINNKQVRLTGIYVNTCEKKRNLSTI